MKSTTFKIILLFFSLLFLFNCQSDVVYQDYQSEEKNAILKSKELYNSVEIQNWLKSQNINLKNKILWDLALISSKNTDGSVIVDVPVEREESIFLEKFIFIIKEDIQGQLWTFRSDKPFLLDFDKSYRLSVHEITNNFEGELIRYSLNDKKVKVINNVHLTTYDYPSYGSVCNSCHMGGGEPTELPELVITFPGMGDGGWDYDWGGSDMYNPIPEIVINPDLGDSPQNDAPDCESFNFQNATSLWQEAAVKNIHFKIYLLNENGVKLQYNISYPQAMSFGMPRNLVIGNTNVTPGVAASIAAQAVKNAMSDTVYMYGNSNASEMTVSDYFLDRLETIFENMVPGGRFQSNYYSKGIKPSEYGTNLFGIGDCN